jgi:O-antigen/teichoic acid export membrane protein
VHTPILKSVSRSRHYRLAKEGAWIIVGQVSSVLSSLVLVRALTEYLDPAQYGELALGLTLVGLVNQVIMGGLGNGIGRFYTIAAEKNDFGNYLSAASRLMGIGTAVVLAIGLSLLAVLRFLDQSLLMPLAAAALLFALLSAYNSTLSGVQNAARRRPIVALNASLDSWLKILLAIALMLWLGSSSAVVLLAYAMSASVVTMSQLVFLRRLVPGVRARSGERAVWARQIWTYAWPFSCWGIFTWAQQSSDRWALQLFTTTDEVGHYAVLFQLGYTPIAIATGMALSFIGPILYQRSGDATSAERNADVHTLAWRITVTCLGLTVIGVAAACLLHEWIFALLAGPEFRRLSYLLPWVVLAGGLFAAAEMLALKLQSDMRSAAMLRPKIVTALIGIGLNVLGASVAGTRGVTFAAVSFSSLYLLWMLHLSRPRVTAAPVPEASQ